MIWNGRFWSWFLSASLYVAALYSYPVFNSSGTFKDGKETLSQSVVLSISPVFNNGKNQLSSFKRQGSVENPYLRLIYHKNKIVTKIKGLFEQYILNRTFDSKRLNTLRLQYLIYPYHHHW